MWLAANFLESGAEKRSSAVVVDVVDEPELPGLAMICQAEPRETQQLDFRFLPLPRLNTQAGAGASECQGVECERDVVSKRQTAGVPCWRGQMALLGRWPPGILACLSTRSGHTTSSTPQPQKWPEVD